MHIKVNTNTLFLLYYKIVLQRQWMSLKKSELSKSVRMIKDVLHKSDKYEASLQAFKTCQRELASLYYKL